MKRIEFVLCLFFISTVSFAQKEIAPTKNLDAYIGTWMYQSNDTIFKIVLKKGYAEDQHMIINGLMGGYFLSVKGIIVENYFSIRDTIWHLDKKKGTQDFSIWASNNATSLDYIDPNRVGVLFYDQRKKHFGGKGILGGKILLLSSDKIRWHLDEKLGLALEEPDEYTELIGFSVPSDVIKCIKSQWRTNSTLAFDTFIFIILQQTCYFKTSSSFCCKASPSNPTAKITPLGSNKKFIGIQRIAYCTAASDFQSFKSET